MISYSDFSDQQLADELKSGDHQAFAEIYHRYKNVLYRHAYQRLRKEEEVDDIIHELFANLWDGRNELSFGSNLAGYLFNGVRNRILNHISHARIESEYIASFQGFLEKGEDSADFLLRERQLGELIDREIALLPSKMREVFELSRKQGLSHREIGQKLSISEKTVKTQVNNALKILRGKFGISVLIYLATIYK